MFENILLGILGLVAVGAGLGVILMANPINSVMSLLVAMLALAGFYIALGAHVVALFQIIIYIGAILVLFLFVIMLLNLKETGDKLMKGPATTGIGVVALGLTGLIGWLLWGSLKHSYFLSNGKGLTAPATVHALALDLFSRHLFIFELTSVLLLVAAIGAILISRK